MKKKNLTTVTFGSGGKTFTCEATLTKTIKPSKVGHDIACVHGATTHWLARDGVVILGDSPTDSPAVAATLSNLASPSATERRVKTRTKPLKTLKT